MDFIDLKTQYQKLEKSINQRIKTVLDHGQYIMGPEIKELESVLAEFVGVKHAIGVANGTDALLIAMMALGIGAGDEVITTPFTFIATGEMIALLGAKPVFVDIDAKTYNIDPNKLATAITPRTKAIMPVSLYGQCADFTAINAIAEKHGIAVIEDAAQSFGATYQGRYSCGLTTIACTSFFPSKPLGCYGDGGACFTNDADLAKAMQEIRIHGQDRRYHHPRIGLNGRLDTLQAAILLAKMEIFSAEVTLRENIGQRYTKAFPAHLCPPHIKDGNTSVYAQYTIQVPQRQVFCDQLKQAGIPTAVHYPIPLHLQPAFDSLELKRGALPIAEAAADRVVSLPMGPYLTTADQDRVIEVVLETYAKLAQH